MGNVNDGGMHGKTVIVTGANSGIGKVTARELARMGARVVMVCRDCGRGEAAKADVIAETGNDSVDLVLADFASQAAIYAVAVEILDRYDRIDALVNNAGAMFGERQLTEDGYEMTFGVNHLGYFLFTHLLLDRIKASTPARIVNVASRAHSRETLNFDDLQHERGYRAFSVYGESKLANVYFTYERAKRLDGAGVTVNCLHPGVVATNFGSGASALFRLALTLGRPLFISPANGAETSVYLASSSEVEGVTGKYFDKCKPIESSRVSYDEDAARKLWGLSVEMTGLKA